MPDPVVAQGTAASGALRPAEVADALGVSPATLRRWSRRFEAYLQARDRSADGSHRRYTPHDLETLRQIKVWLEAGQTYEEVAHQLDAQLSGSAGPQIDVIPAGAQAKEQEPAARTAAVAVQPSAAPVALDGREALSNEGWPPAAQILRDALQAVTDNQQLLLSTQHANRDLMGVVIQDNLNLKDENANLRERMLELERELAELRRRHAEFRERLETRVRVLEDAVAALMARPQAPPPTMPSAPPPSYGPYPPQPERRGFWARLLGG